MRKTILLLTWLLIALTQLHAQNSVLKGRVLDEQGNPVSKATIGWKNRSIATVTGEDGSFAIAVPTGTAGNTLVVSAINFESKEIGINSLATVTITLKTSVANLSEVVVVAYGTQKKEASTGSIAVVKSDVLNNRPVSSVEKALQGQTAGITVQSVSGQPGAASTVRIRGVGSFNASNDPLYVIDGVAVTTGDLSQASQTANVLSTINPDDIESISVLKDASAAALYGSRAGNGVILITTKRGTSGKAKLGFSASTGWSDIAVNRYDLLSGEQYFKYYWDYFYRTRINAGDAAALAAQTANTNTIKVLAANPYNSTTPYDQNGRLNPDVKLLYDHDWRKDVRRTGNVQDYQLNVSGGNDRTLYYLSGAFFKQKGITPASDLKRYSVKLNLDNRPTNFLKIGINTTLSYSEQNTPPGGGGAANPIRFADIVSNVYPLYQLDANGQPVKDAAGIPQYNWRTPVVFDYNPLGLARDNIFNLQTVRALTSGYAEAALYKGLRFRTQTSADLIDIRETMYYNSQHGDGASVGGRTNKYAPRDLTLTITNTLAYDFRTGYHNINILLGQEAVRNRYQNLSAGGTTFPFAGQVELNSAGIPSSVGSDRTDKRLSSYFSRVNYGFKDKYFVTGSLRRDGSSVFGSNNRYGTFWSAGAAWRLSEERFLAGTKSWLTELKLRGSYGISGNDNIGRYARLGLYSTGNNYEGQSGITFNQLDNSNLKWETNAVTDIAIELVLFKRIRAELGYFNRQSKDILFNKPLSQTTGFSSILTNLASMKNYGFEALIEAQAITAKNFNWTVSLNLTTTTNQIQKMTVDSILQGNLIWRVGKDRYQYYLREYAGVDPADGRPTWYVGAAGGHRDVTKDWNAATRYHNGSALPKFYGGVTNRFSYKNFDLSFFVFFNLGNKIYDDTYASQMSGGAVRGQQLTTDIYKAWTKPGDITDVPRFVDRNTDLGNNASTRFLFSGSYVRLKTASIGYALPSRLLSAYKISNVRVFASGENLLTWAKHKGMDPETSISGTNSYDIPNVRTVTVGLTLGL